MNMLTSCTSAKEKPKSPKLRALRARNFGLFGSGARCEYGYMLDNKDGIDVISKRMNRLPFDHR